MRGLALGRVALGCALLLVLQACAKAPSDAAFQAELRAAEQEQAREQENRALFSRYQAEVFNGNDFSIDTLRKFFTEQFVDHSSLGGGASGLESLASRSRRLLDVFHPARQQTEFTIADGDFLAVLFGLEAAQASKFLGLDGEGRKLQVRGIEIYRFERQQGVPRIAERWGIFDLISTANALSARVVFEPGGEPSRLLSEGSARVSIPQPKPLPVPPDDADLSALDDPTLVERLKEVRGLRRLQQANQKALVRFQEEAFNADRFTIEQLSQFVTRDIVDHASNPSDPPGVEGLRNRFTAWRESFGAAAEANSVIVTEADRIAVMYELNAKHSGDFLGIPATGKPFAIPGIEIVRFEQEGGAPKIAEHWGIYDMVGTAAQLGAGIRLEAVDQVPLYFPNPDSPGQ